MAAALERIEVANEGRVSINVVRALLDTAEYGGLSRRQLLAAANVDPSLLEASDGQIGRSTIYKLFEVAMEVSQDSTVALRWGAALQDQALPVVSHLVKYATTLGEAFEALFRFSKLLSDEAGTRLLEQGDIITVHCRKAPGASESVQRFMDEMTLSGIYRLIRSYSPAGRVERVCFAYPSPHDRAGYAQAFDSHERFNQPFTGILFEKSMMHATSPYRDEDLLNALRTLAERRLRHVTHCTPYSVRAHEVLLRQRAPQLVPMRDVAKELELSVRSLRRRLSEEGKSYREIANDACTTVATRLIADERRSIQETAYAMGFTDTSSFHRAFKRWTGATPGEYRQQA